MIIQKTRVRPSSIICSKKWQNLYYSYSYERFILIAITALSVYEEIIFPPITTYPNKKNVLNVFRNQNINKIEQQTKLI